MKQTVQFTTTSKEAYIAPIVASDAIRVEQGFAASYVENSAASGYEYFDENGDY
jgi:hypothetical protein